MKYQPLRIIRNETRFFVCIEKKLFESPFMPIGLFIDLETEPF